LKCCIKPSTRRAFSVPGARRNGVGKSPNTSSMPPLSPRLWSEAISDSDGLRVIEGPSQAALRQFPRNARRAFNRVQTPPRLDSVPKQYDVVCLLFLAHSDLRGLEPQSLSNEIWARHACDGVQRHGPFTAGVLFPRRNTKRTFCMNLTHTAVA